MSASEKYECSLEKASLKKAAKELNEDPKERESAVASFRQWIEQNNAWLKTPTDTKFLLAFLRNAKFVQLAARKRLVNFWTSRTECKEWFHNIDVLDPVIVECIRLGSFIVLPKKNKEGQIILIGRTGCMDVTGKYSVDDLMRSFAPMLDFHLMDENAQVNGYVIIEDMGDLTIKHQTMFGLDTVKKTMSAWIKSYPARYKGIHYYNTNPIFDAMFAIFSPFYPEKLKQRLHFHGKKLTDLYQYVDKSCLPEEYLPDDCAEATVGTAQDCVEDFIRKLQQPEVRDFLLRLYSPEFGVKLDLKPKDDELFNEAFRKLNVD
ncbi:alpha-tocopherol transfer protein-like [Liolophura sinensis]|uniref:alpha-tocopherol transfer protein-like n=1 Tax=Liolophura sinensis TaxID=3198878 RepID=UPI0031586EE2